MKIVVGGARSVILEEHADDNVAMIRGPYETTMSVREAVAERLAD